MIPLHPETPSTKWQAPPRRLAVPNHRRTRANEHRVPLGTLRGGNPRPLRGCAVCAFLLVSEVSESGGGAPLPPFAAAADDPPVPG